MLTFPNGTPARARAMISAAPIVVQNRVVGLLKADAVLEALRLARVIEGAEIDEQMQATGLQFEMTAREEKRYGRPEEREIRTINPDRSETIELIPTGKLAKIEENLKALKARRAELSATSKTKKRKWGRFALETLGEYRGRLDEDTSEIALDQRDGESLIEAHKRKWAEVITLNRNVRTLRNAPIPASDALALLNRYVDSHARAPDLGAFTRGEHFARRGGIEFGPPPDARPTWPTSVYVPQVDPPDVVGILCWLLPDVLKSAAAAELRKKDSPDAVSVAIKREEVPKLESRLWQGRRELELLTITGIAQGLTNLNRLPDTPTEILLNVRPFGETPGLSYDPPDLTFENGDDDE